MWLSRGWIVIVAVAVLAALLYTLAVSILPDKTITAVAVFLMAYVLYLLVTR